MRRLTAFALVAIGLAVLSGCGSAQPRGSLVVGIQYIGGAWHAARELGAGRVAILDERGHRVGVLDVKAGQTARTELPPGTYRLAGDGSPTVNHAEGCQRPETATVTADHATDYTLTLGCWPLTPKGVLASIVAAGLAQKSVHVSESHGEDMFGTSTWTVDATADSGTELFDYYGSEMRVLLVHRTVYVRADDELLYDGLAGGIDLTRAQAKRYAEKWISIPKGDKLYAPLASGLTLGSIVQSATPRSRFTPVEKLKLRSRTSHGTRLLVVQGAEERTFVSEMTARAGGTPLPVTFDDSCGMMCDSTGTFSKWNEPVHVRAPASSTSIATVRG